MRGRPVAVRPGALPHGASAAQPRGESPGGRALSPEIKTWRWRRVLLWPPLRVLVGDCVLAVVLFGNVWVHPGGAWIGDNHDASIMMWYVGWLPHHLMSLPRHPLFTDFIMYPAGANLMWNASLIFPSLVLWPVTAIFGPVVSFNVLATLALGLSSWEAYLVVRRYASNEVVAALAGVVYGFSPYMILQSLGHTNLTVAVFPPLAWLLLDELFVRRRWHPALVGALLGAASAAQLLTSPEILAATILVSGMGAALLALLHWSSVEAAIPRVLSSMAVALLTFLALAAYPLKSMFLGSQTVSGVLQPQDVYVADLLSFVIPPGYVFLGAAQTSWVAARFTGFGVETGAAYLGVPGLTLLALAVAIGWRSNVVRFAGLLFLAISVLALGPRLHIAGHVTGLRLPWAVVQHLPLMQSAIPARLMVFGWLTVAVILGVVGSRLMASGRRGVAAVAVLGVLFVAPIFPMPPLVATQTYAPSFFSSRDVIRIREGSVALVTPWSNQASSVAMYWQMAADYRFKMPEGIAYVPGPSFNPPSSLLQQDLVELDYGTYPSQAPANEAAEVKGELTEWKVDTVIVGPSRGEHRIVEFFTRVLGRAPQRTGGVWVWWNVQSTIRASADAAAVAVPQPPG